MSLTGPRLRHFRPQVKHVDGKKEVLALFLVKFDKDPYQHGDDSKPIGPVRPGDGRLGLLALRSKTDQGKQG